MRSSSTTRIGFLVAALAAAASASAADAATGGSSSQTTGWSYAVTPYLWVATLTGDVGADGAQGSTESDYSFFALENLERYGAAHFAATSAHWGAFADWVYVDFGDSFTRSRIETSLGLKGDVYELGASYALGELPQLTLLGGLRLIDIDTRVELNPGPDGSGGQRFTDPFIGVEYRHAFAGSWYVDARGDIGLSADRTSQVVASVGYRFGDRLEAFGGYRYLKAELRDEIVADVALQGPGIGFTWRW
jgi:hypothetical protein